MTSHAKPPREVFENTDDRLLSRVEQCLTERSRAGLEGLVGGLECVVINVEPGRLDAAVHELTDWTGLSLVQAFKTDSAETRVLTLEGSADFMITARKNTPGPFRALNLHPKSETLPETRLETLVFQCPDLEAYVARQHEAGVEFLTAEPVQMGSYRFIQTPPSAYTGNSLGFIQWLDRPGLYTPPNATELAFDPSKPERPYLFNVKELDHAATRVRAEHRDEAIIEFMKLTNYRFDFAIYVESLNSITNVARLSHDDYAMVFTSGISPFTDLRESGPTEQFIHNYGARVHHIAFRTENIDQTFNGLKNDGMEFLVELIGSPGEGLKQTFTEPFANTMLVYEYIHRYGDFDGFFTKSNVTVLTEATARQ